MRIRAKSWTPIGEIKLPNGRVLICEKTTPKPGYEGETEVLVVYPADGKDWDTYDWFVYCEYMNILKFGKQGQPKPSGPKNWPQGEHNVNETLEGYEDFIKTQEDLYALVYIGHSVCIRTALSTSFSLFFWDGEKIVTYVENNGDLLSRHEIYKAECKLGAF